MDVERSCIRFAALVIFLRFKATSGVDPEPPLVTDSIAAAKLTMKLARPVHLRNAVWPCRTQRLQHELCLHKLSSLIR